MARLARFVLPGQPQHVIQRGNNRQAVFFAEDDYQFYGEKLIDACGRYDCHVHAYVMMTNHVHLLITPMTETGISKVMQSLGRCYVQRVNFNHRRTGTLWEGRYRATLPDSERYLLRCYRYIELNPIRAGMVEQIFRAPFPRKVAPRPCGHGRASGRVSLVEFPLQCLG